MRKSRTPPNLSNYTPGAIVDECAPMVEQFNDLKWSTDFYKTAIKARRAPEFATADPYVFVIKGEKYAAVITETTREAFSKDEAIRRGFLTEEQYQECYVASPVTYVNFEKLEPVQQQNPPPGSKEAKK